MKQLFILIISLICTINIYAKFTVSVAPSAIVEGEFFDIVIIADTTPAPQLTGHIAGVNVIGQAVSVVTRNAKTESQLRIRCSTNQTGKVTIPPFEIIVNDKIEQTLPLKLEVQTLDSVLNVTNSNNDNSKTNMNLPNPKKIVSAIGSLGVARSHVYVGELVVLNLVLYYQLNYVRDISVGVPSLNLGQAIVSDFSQLNPRNPSFLPVTEFKTKIGNVEYGGVLLRTSFRPLATGKVQLKATQDAKLYTKQNGRISMELDYQMPEVNVVEIPAAPDDDAYVNLLGNWAVTTEQSRNQLATGEAMTLSVIIQGQGVLSTLQAPELTFENCRVYPPEVEFSQQSNQVTLRYIVIPLQAGELVSEKSFYTFSPITEEYARHFIKLKLNVTQGKEQLVPEVEESIEAENVEVATALELNTMAKLNLENSIKLPLYRNKLLWILLFTVSGLVSFCLIELRRYYRHKKSTDPSWVRKNRAHSLRGGLLQQIENAKDDELLGVVNHSVVPFLNDTFDYPPGSDCSKIAELTKDSKLAELLTEASANNYLPESQRQLTNPRLFKSQLLKQLKKLTLWLAVFASTSLCAASWDEAVDAMYESDKTQALFMFDKLYTADNSNPAILYNLGSLFYQVDEPAKALWAFERAHLLAPRDPEIIDALNIVRRKFFQKPVDSASSIVEAVSATKDWLRPDDYMLLASIMIFAIFMILIFRRRVGKLQTLTLCGGLSIAVVLIVVVITWQFNTSYNSQRAIVIARDATLSSLPSSNIEGVKEPIPAGTQFVIKSYQNDYALVESNGNSGYLKIVDLWLVL